MKPYDAPEQDQEAKNRECGCFFREVLLTVSSSPAISCASWVFSRLFCHQTCMKRSRSRCCPNPDCSLRGQAGKGNIIRHSFYITSQGRRRRYRCKECGRTFSSTHGTPYYRLHKPRSMFDEVVRMCVHGIGISAMARIKRMSWGTVARWLQSAATYAARFNDRMLKGFLIRELQADEIRTFAGAT